MGQLLCNLLRVSLPNSCPISTHQRPMGLGVRRSVLALDAQKKRSVKLRRTIRGSVTLLKVVVQQLENVGHVGFGSRSGQQMAVLVNHRKLGMSQLESAQSNK